MTRRRRRRSFGFPNWFLVLLFLGGLYLLEFAGQERDKRRDSDVEVKAKIPRSEGPPSPKFGGSVFLFDSKQSLTEPMVHRMARGQSNDHISIWTVSGDRHAFATAPGFDRIHHFVNAYLEGYAPFEAENIFTPLQTLARVKTYQFDHLDATGHQELWQTSREAFYYTRGDCEDHALALADWLMEMGEDARVVSGDYRGEGHAWVILFKNGKEYLFEATDKRRAMRQLSLASMHPDYQPRWMFNRDYFWYNTGSPRTVKYSGRKWKRKSRYAK